MYLRLSARLDAVVTRLHSANEMGKVGTLFQGVAADVQGALRSLDVDRIDATLTRLEGHLDEIHVRDGLLSSRDHGADPPDGRREQFGAERGAAWRAAAEMAEAGKVPKRGGTAGARRGGRVARAPAGVTAAMSATRHRSGSLPAMAAECAARPGVSCASAGVTTAMSATACRARIPFLVQQNVQPDQSDQRDPHRQPGAAAAAAAASTGGHL
eukprot:ctg_652.g423